MADNEKNTAEEYLLEVVNLCKYFVAGRNFFGKPKRFLKAVDNVSFNLKKGQTLGIVGDSGCGKITLANSIMHPCDVTCGDILCKGQKISELKERELGGIYPEMQIIYRDSYKSLPPRVTVGDAIGKDALKRGVVSKSEYRDYVLRVMQTCGLPPQNFGKKVREISNVQRQIVCIARALALKPELIICDEPFSATDAADREQIMNVLTELREKLGLTCVLLARELSALQHVSDEVGVMYLGSLVEYGTAEEMFSGALHPYTKALLTAAPVETGRLKGDAPSPVNPPQGCKFHTRCERCMDICTKVKPEYKEVTPGHFCACHLNNTPEENEQCKAELHKITELERITALCKSYMRIGGAKKKKGDGNKTGSPK